MFVRVAQRDHFDGRDLDEAEQIALAIPAGADQADAFGFLVDEFDAIAAEGREGERRGRGLEETAAINCEAHRKCVSKS